MSTVTVDDIPGLSPKTTDTAPDGPAPSTTAPAAPEAPPTTPVAPPAAPAAPAAPPAAPAAPETTLAPPPPAAPAAPAPDTNVGSTEEGKEEPGVELDAEGLPWDARIHSSGKTKYSTKAGPTKLKGTWTHKRGVKEEEVAKVKAELREKYPDNPCEDKGTVEDPGEKVSENPEASELPAAPEAPEDDKDDSEPEPKTPKEPVLLPEDKTTDRLSEDAKAGLDNMLDIVSKYESNLKAQLGQIEGLKELMVEHQKLAAKFTNFFGGVCK